MNGRRIGKGSVFAGRTFFIDLLRNFALIFSGRIFAQNRKVRISGERDFYRQNRKGKISGMWLFAAGHLFVAERQNIL